MVDGVPPNAGFLGRVSPVAFVRDDDIKSVDGNVEGFRIFLHVRITLFLGKGVLVPEQIDGHSLHRGDVNERLAGLWIRQVASGKNLRIKGLFIPEILPPEPLAIHLVFLAELVPCGRVEGRKLSHGLSCQCFPIHEEKDFLGRLGCQAAGR